MGDSTQVLVSGALFVLAVLTLLRHRVALAFFVLVVTGFGVLYTFVHAGALRHWGFYQVALVAAVWLAAHQGTKTSTLMGRLLAVAPTIAAVLILIPWGYRGLDATRREVNERFSNAPAMARFIREQGLHTRTIAMHVEAIAVVPWLPEMKPWYPSIESSTSYLPWNTRQAQTRGMSGIELARRTTRKFRGDDSVLLLVRVQLKEEDARRYDWQLLHVEEVPTWFYNGEKLYLYQRASSAMKRLNHQQ